MRKLTVDDIVDHRAYEREREAFRSRIIEMKRRRRVPLGGIMTAVFENTETMRFQVQEMARAERMLREDQIAHEVETYNELVPDDGQLSATLFVEIDDADALHEWLPKLVGIEAAVAFELADGTRVGSRVDDPDRLTHEQTTSAVHYLKFDFDAGQRAIFARGPVRLVVDHPNYAASVELDQDRHRELTGDLGDGLAGGLAGEMDGEADGDVGAAR